MSEQEVIKSCREHLIATIYDAIHDLDECICSNTDSDLTMAFDEKLGKNEEFRYNSKIEEFLEWLKTVEIKVEKSEDVDDEQ